jgi:hypothetical protein
MALGIPVANLGLPLERCYEPDAFGLWLAQRHGIWLRQRDIYRGRGERLWSRALYLCGVRSLNLVNSDHSVLLDTRAPRKEGANYTDRSGWKCFDPNQGREGLKLYTWVDEYSLLDVYELVEETGDWRFEDPVQESMAATAE